MSLLMHYTDDGLTASFMRRNLDDPITSSGSTARSNFENKINIDNLYMQLTKLLNGKVRFQLSTETFRMNFRHQFMLF